MKDEDQVLDAVPTLAWEELFDGASDAPVQPFVPFLDETGRLGAAPALHLMGLRGERDAGFASVWSYADADDDDDLRRVFAWMWSRADLWSIWGRAAVGLGPGFLSRIVARDLQGGGPAAWPAPPVDAGAGDGDHADHNGDADMEVKAQLWCFRQDVGYRRDRSYGIFLDRRHLNPDLAFFALHFTKAGERDRVWDWMQHQTGRYREFEQHHEAHGHRSLKRLVYGGMLETERAVKKMGLGSGGARPLRFWPGPPTEDSDA